MPSDALTEKILEETVKRAGLWGEQQSHHFPTIVRSGTLANGRPVHYVLNYSADAAQVKYGFTQGKELLSGDVVKQDSTVALPAWGVAVIEEGAK